MINVSKGRFLHDTLLGPPTLILLLLCAMYNFIYVNILILQIHMFCVKPYVWLCFIYVALVVFALLQLALVVQWCDVVGAVLVRVRSNP